MRSHRVSVRAAIKEQEKHYTQYQKGIDQFAENKNISAVEEQTDQDSDGES